MRYEYYLATVGGCELGDLDGAAGEDLPLAALPDSVAVEIPGDVGPGRRLWSALNGHTPPHGSVHCGL